MKNKKVISKYDANITMMLIEVWRKIANYNHDNPIPLRDQKVVLSFFEIELDSVITKNN